MRRGAYYNEHDPFAAAWLRNLISAGHIAPGDVDERDIRDIQPGDLRGYVQCHFFAGIGVWSYALRNAGWADDRPIWTGSCPCQPFSTAGRGDGFADERHLWPYWHWLIAQLRPPVVAGEQVASKDGLGWLDLVSADMEGTNYAFGASDLCAAGFGGAHIRQRLYFVGMADAGCSMLQPRVIAGNDTSSPGSLEGEARQLERSRSGHRDGSPTSRMADAEHERHNRSGGARTTEQSQGGRADVAGLTQDDRDGPAHAPMLGRDAVDWIFCRDGKWRPIGPGAFPLVDETPARVGRLRAYGNALDAETATQFVGAVKAIDDFMAVV